MALNLKLALGFLFSPEGPSTSETELNSSALGISHSLVRSNAVPNSGNYEQIAAATPIVVAHVVSLIKCAKEARVTGFLDAAAVLRHSIHKNSVHSGTSKYSYQMYAIVHESCKDHAHALDRLGYQAIVKPSPVTPDDIAPGYLKGHIEMENCCGSAEFIK